MTVEDVKDDVLMLEAVDSVPSIPPEARQEMAQIEKDLANAELVSLRRSVALMRPIYERRSKLISQKLESSEFWPRVFLAAPQETSDHFLPEDMDIIRSCLRSFHVERFNVDEAGEKGEPRDLRFVFEFSREGEGNQWFAGDDKTNLKVEKIFHWRKFFKKTGSGVNVWEGLVSEPVRIAWKDGADPTKGLLDAVCNLAEAEKKIQEKNGHRITDEERTALPEFEKLVTAIESAKGEMENNEEGEGDDDSVIPPMFSFFNWFGYRGRDITAEESVASEKEEEAYWQSSKEDKQSEKKENGNEQNNDEDDDDEDEENVLEDAEISPGGEELAISLADDVWQNAIKLYSESYAVDDELDLDFEDDEEDDDEDGEEEDDGEDEGKGEGGKDEDEEDKPPKKKSKTTA